MPDPNTKLANVLGLFPTFFPGSGKSLQDSGDLTTFANLEFSYRNNITAGAGGGVANAVPLTAAINEVTTVGTAADSLMLPTALPGMVVWVVNHGALSCQVIGQQLDPNTGAAAVIYVHNTTAAAGATAGVAQASGAIASYMCFRQGAWKQVLGS